jgi:uncharacterized protein (DUF486 family)
MLDLAEQNACMMARAMSSSFQSWAWQILVSWGMSNYIGHEPMQMGAKIFLTSLSNMAWAENRYKADVPFNLLPPHHITHVVIRWMLTFFNYLHDLQLSLNRLWRHVLRSQQKKTITKSLHCTWL